MALAEAAVALGALPVADLATEVAPRHAPCVTQNVTAVTNATPRGLAAGTSALSGSKESHQCSSEPLSRSKRRCLIQKHFVWGLWGTLFPGEGVFNVRARAAQGEQPTVLGGL